jgi:predicted  nucleic acid-binding Zn-ribbon protein
MPHQCTNCDRIFADGSKEMLSGCPDCGGNKFQFKPDPSTPTPTLDDGAPRATPQTGSEADADADYIEAEPDPSALGEDTAQADARRDVVSRDELDDTAPSPPPSADDAARTIPPDADGDADSPGLDDLRAELNDQFESIRIVEPGQYELNLMELYDRQECIISLREDGHYVIEVVDTWRDSEP